MSLKKRNEIPVELTWNTKDIFSSEEEFLKGIEKLKNSIVSFNKKYNNNLNSDEIICSGVKDYLEIMVLLDQLSNFAYLEYSVDLTNPESMSRMGKLQVLEGEYLPQLSFFKSQLLEVEEDIILRAIKMEPSYETYLKDILREKPHTLDPKTEEALSAFRPTLNSFSNIYENLKQADMVFPEFEVKGEKYPLSFVLFENKYQYSIDTEVRRKAFEEFSKVLKKYENGFATNYNAHVQREKIESRLRGFDSVIDYLLFDQKVDVELYHRQIDLIMKDLAPVMRKYAKLIQKTYGLEKMTYADLKTPLDPSFAPEVSIEEGWNYSKNALKVMGEEYVSKVEEAQEKRWIDFAENLGKSTGGFCAGPYGVHPYVLLSWTGLLSEVFTLVHELGHALHFIKAQENHNILSWEPSLYLIEAPSTCHEMLLTNYLMEQNEDSRFKRWVLSSMIENTYYHNFVTHLLEAHYQREVYALVDKGETLNATILNELKLNTLKEFWGEEVEINPGAELTWMRQPHYFMGLYPYTYSAGLTISTVASQRILKEGQPAVKDWIDFLEAGGAYTPVELAKIAKVDITTDKALKETIEYISNMVDEIIELSEEI